MPDQPAGTVTFLFTDIEGSTHLLQYLGDRYVHVAGEHKRLLRTAFQEAGGYEVETAGDSFFIAFPRAWDAVRAAVAAQRAINAHPWPEGAPVRVRMGMHTGEATSAFGSYVGLDVHRAGRIMSAGYGGQVVLSQATADALTHDFPEGVTLRDLGEHRLKDLARPEHMFQLVIPDLPADFPPLKTLDVISNNLPVLSTSFIGREREIEDVKRLLTTARLVSLLGAGGAGKTRLAIQVAADLIEEFKNGVWLTELAPLEDPALVVQTVASKLGVREVAGRALLDSLVDYLQPKTLLLVLDNCEHLVAACAQMVTALLRACPNLRVLATSREALGIVGEAVYRVPPLSRPDPRRITSPEELTQFESPRLFVERAVCSQPQFALTSANATAVAHICHRLDGIPLAIELAAAQVRSLKVEEISSRLDDRFRLLTGGLPTALPQHQTLQAAIDWSYDLLAETERVLLRRLAVFAGGSTLEAAEAVCAGDDVAADDVLDLLANLVDKSLVVAEGLNGDVRYRLLETIRQYGRERLEAEEAGVVHAKHLDWYLRLAEQAEPELKGPEQLVWLERLEAEHDNSRAALQYCRSSDGSKEACLRLAGALARFWARRGFLSEGRDFLETAIVHGSEAPRAVRAKALYGAGLLAFDQGDYTRSQALCQESLHLHRETGDNQGVALALNILASVAQRRGEYAQAIQRLEESEALTRKLGYQWALAEALNGLALAARRQRNLVRAQTLLEESLHLWRDLGDKWGLAFALAHLGLTVSYQGDHDRAQGLLKESLVLRRELGDRRHVAGGLSSLGTVALMQGDFDQARRYFEESLPFFRELGDKTSLAAALGNLGVAVAQHRNLTEAARLLEESLHLSREMGDRLNTAHSLGFLALVASLQGDWSRAAGLYREALEIFREQGDRLGVGECLVGVAGITLGSGRTDQAARFVAVSEGLHEGLGIPIPPWVRPSYDHLLFELQSRLGVTGLAEARAKGRALAFDLAVREALDSLTGFSGA